ncbi:MAG: DAK2 domain-containing protein [Lachnospiraceae bacterium]|nr:DAK2 domain-containing protein [Lachnospiraceae bacterium]
MSNTTIDASLLARMFLSGARNLETKKEWINELNVFPVPDGDTGTNMTMTIMSAAKDVSSLMSTNDIEMRSLCKAISSGSLRGARGNSGVILSQLLRGFCKSIQDSEQVDIKQISEATIKAVETAYKAVMKPKEGTILTVAKGMSDKAVELAGNGCDDLEEFITGIINYGDEVLARTPDMLPVLKQAGVVDSGGQGLMEVMKGALDAFLGKEVSLDFSAESGSSTEAEEAEPELKYTYNAEFIISLHKTFNVKTQMDLTAFLESIGDSIACVVDGDIVKVHVNTNDPGLAVQKALTYGELSSIKIDNMRLEHDGKSKNPSDAAGATDEVPMEHKDVAFIAVSVGDGINEIFKSLGVDYIIEGGQTMNPSTEDMLNAIDKVNADTIYILPNNKNIIMAANQAKSMTEDKKIIVIPTKTVPQGITAVINYVPDMNPDDNAATMECEIKNVSTGQVTYAVRDTVIDDMEIHQGDYMGIGDQGILSVGRNYIDTAFEMIRDMIDDDKEIISIYYGAEITEDEANTLNELVQEAFPNVDVDLQYGGQPIYYFIVSAE